MLIPFWLAIIIFLIITVPPIAIMLIGSHNADKEYKRQIEELNKSLIRLFFKDFEDL